MKLPQRRSRQESTHMEGNTTDKNRAQGRRHAHAPTTSSGSCAHFTAAIACLLIAAFLTSCQAQQEQTVLRPTVQINGIDVITSTRYIGDAFAFTGQDASASLVPDMDRLPPYAPGISFLGFIAQDTLSSGCDKITPCDILLLGIFRQQNGTFRYGYEVNGVRHYAGGHVLASDYKSAIFFYLNEDGLVTDPTYPQRSRLRFGYDFQMWSGGDGSIPIHGLSSSPIYANQLFVGGMDESNEVQLPDQKQLELRIWPPSDDQTPSVIYTNGDETSQVSSQYSETEEDILLTLSGSDCVSAC
jgi:hypothetical protein